MRWLDATLFTLWAGAGLLGTVVLAGGCSNSSAPSTGTLPPSSQPAPTKFEAGANCASDDDCEPGLSCLFPASACNALAVCITPASPASSCDHPQVACSCLGEPIAVCDGYATNPVDPTATCDGGSVIAKPDGGPDATVPVADGGPDAGPDASPLDAAPLIDASDAAGD